MADADPEEIRLRAVGQLQEILNTLQSDRHDTAKVLDETSEKLNQIAAMIVMPVPTPSSSSSASIDCPYCNHSVTVTLSK